MSTPVRLLAFALVLALVFGGGVALGTAVGPFDDDPAPSPTHRGWVSHEGHP